MILVIIVGLFGLFIGAIIQWMNMNDDVEYLKEVERERRYGIAFGSVTAAREQFRGLSKEANNISHDADYSDAVREYHVTAAEIWGRAANCMEHRLVDIEAQRGADLINE